MGCCAHVVQGTNQRKEEGALEESGTEQTNAWARDTQKKTEVAGVSE